MNFTRNGCVALLLMLLACTLNGCMPKRRINGTPLLKKNVIVFDGETKAKHPSKGDLGSFVQQQPNKTTLWVFWFKPWLYEQMRTPQPNRFRIWIMNNFAQKPVYYSEKEAKNSSLLMEKYLFSKGFFDAQVECDFDNKDLSTVTYHVALQKPYIIDKIFYNFSDTTLLPFVFEINKGRLLKSGDHYDEDILDRERERITSHLRNQGYYKFSKNHIRYRVDSTLQDNRVNVIMDFLLAHVPSEQNDNMEILAPHYRYKIRNIYITPNYHPFNRDIMQDTLLLSYKRSRGDNRLADFHFLYHEKMKVRPKTYTRRIFFSNGEYYNQSMIQDTYKGLSGLLITRFVNIDFEQVVPDTGDTLSNDTNQWLDCNIKLHKQESRSYSIEAEGTQNVGKPGIASRLIYQNKNLFGGAEIFNINLSGALESKKKKTVENENERFLFNTLEGSVEMGISFPRFLLPMKPEMFLRNYSPSTSIMTGYNYQKRRDYTRYLTNLSLSYRWNQTATKRHVLTPIDLNAVKIYTDPEFEKRLQRLEKKYREQYTDHLLLSIKYDFLWNTQEIGSFKDFWFLRTTLESSGVLIHALNKQFNFDNNNNENYATIFNIRYSQFLRSVVDVRFYHYLSKSNVVVFRWIGGLGVPYGNSNSLPFEKAFYCGGANGMRGWALRSLGPGAYNNEDGLRFDQVGDIILEMNAEYRFPIHGYFNGALFMDVGNVWLLEENKDFPQGHFSWRNFYQQMGIDAGFGLRVDFQFVIIRLDVATPLYSPVYPNGRRWEPARKMRLMNFVPHFGIGFPF